MDQRAKTKLLQYLPAIFQSRQEALLRTTLPTPSTSDGAAAGPFLADFLQPFEEAFDEYNALLSALDRYVAPELTPTDEFLPWLAGWVALLLDEEWDEDQRRRLIGEAVELYRWRGTQQGLKRYLQLYTGLPVTAFEIFEAAWPGGMQIGVASQIGVRLPSMDPSTPKPADEPAEPLPPPGEVGVATQEFYVIDTLSPPALPSDITLPPIAADGEPIRIYLRSDRVQRVAIKADGVELTYQVSANETQTLRYPKATTNPKPNIQRRSELTQYRYRFDTGGTASTRRAYVGGTFLIEQAPLPYRFVLRIHIPEAAFADYVIYNPEAEPTCRIQEGQKLTKIRTILNLEKPAHTDYYLQLVPERRQAALAWMQIEVHSTISLDTTIG